MTGTHTASRLVPAVCESAGRLANPLKMEVGRQEIEEHMSFLNRKNEGNDQKKDSGEPLPSKEGRREKTLIVEASSDTQMPKAVIPSATGPQHTARSRLEHLYRISKILAE